MDCMDDGKSQRKNAIWHNDRGCSCADMGSQFAYMRDAIARI